MFDEQHLNSADRELESTLRSLSPRAAGSSRDELMFRAGRQSLQRSVRLWQGSTATLAAMVLVGLIVRPWPAQQGAAPQLVEHATPPRPGPQTPITTTPDAKLFDLARPTYLVQVEALMEHGLSAMPIDKPPEMPRQDLRQLLEMSPREIGGPAILWSRSKPNGGRS